MIRGDVERCLVIAPGSLVEQWQDELWEKFHLAFDILTRDTIEAARTGNPFAERPLLIARLDHLSRNEDLQAKLAATDWDLVVVDEAHKMSAHYFGNEVKETKRYRLGRLAGQVARHLLLMTATPHSGKEEDFQLFMALLDADRFEGSRATASTPIDTSDLMRRLVKEQLLKFDGTPLFPERRAYSPTIRSRTARHSCTSGSPSTSSEEMNRAERLKAQGEGRRGAVVGFALTILQRRLASSPEAIYQSLPAPQATREQVSRRSASASGAPRSRRDGYPEPRSSSLTLRRTSTPTTCPMVSSRSSRRRSSTRPPRPARSLSSSMRSRGWPSSRSSPVRCGTPAPTESGRSCRASSSTRRRCSTPTGSRRKLIIFSEHRDTLQLPGRAAPRPAGRARGGRLHSRRHAPRGAPQGARRPSPGQGRPRAGRHRRRGGGHQPAARPPDGELRPALEPEPDRAALRATCTGSARPRSATCGTWWRRTRARARCSSGCSRSSRSSARRLVARCSTSRVRHSGAERCVSCSSRPSATANTPK